ncbi:isocitrate lyase/PEP mutase family protein [Aquiflexum lacus]|uniref:isocitrate lyase/PEP mutase family protein n=1 Tax=Aquiflexum lacus TaxID=2483805 RepID=UPI001893BFE8|nr:isocitrate lyase/phosphoenolpyruvate mutase family protein [Aquiflexum lacus]
MTFKELHYQKKPLFICNVWDVSSARIAEKLNFNAIGTSSSAISNLLGYQDGEVMGFSELKYFVKRIAQSTQLPLTVDLESGYSRDSKKIVDHIKQLADLGIVGINIEDSIVSNKRELLDASGFSETLEEVIHLLRENGIDIFINVRIDTFLLRHPAVISETKKRIQMYEHAGADGIFTPCVETISDIKEIVNCTSLPINVMCMPNLPDFNMLENLGVKRISMGNFLHEITLKYMEEKLAVIKQEDSFNLIFNHD